MQDLNQQKAEHCLQKGYNNPINKSDEDEPSGPASGEEEKRAATGHQLLQRGSSNLHGCPELSSAAARAGKRPFLCTEQTPVRSKHTANWLSQLLECLFQVKKRECTEVILTFVSLTSQLHWDKYLCLRP